MTIPKHEDIRLPALKMLGNNESLMLKDFEKPLANHFNLSDEEIAREYESGNGKIFYDRISWALSYMNMAGLLQKPKRGVFQISKLGREKLKTPNNLNRFITSQIEKRDAALKSKHDKRATSKSNLTPQEELYESYDKIRQSVYSEIIDAIQSKSPREFEKLVVMVLQRMGYGGEVKSAAQVTRYTNDKGIDGIIKEDVLGLGRIHIQAKRYDRSKMVGREEIQKFVGALAVAKSHKGVFITTSSYLKSAIEYAESLNGSTTLVLIDGQQLAKFMYEFGVGVQVEHSIEIKKLDSDFWDEMDDN